MAKIINKNNYKYMSRKLLLEKVGTTSLNQMNLKLYLGEYIGKDSEEYIAAYVFHNIDNLYIEEDKFPELIRVMNIYSKSIEKSGDNKYKKVYYELTNNLNKHDNENKTKLEFIDLVNSFKEKSNMSYRKIFEAIDVKYAHGYNFFQKKILRMISIGRIESMKEKFENIANT